MRNSVELDDGGRAAAAYDAIKALPDCTDAIDC